ncbi:histidine kinase dimerization/phospho-acceptor domain-containing protein [Tepidiforma sp.]|uniref:sensor histidine kinase n=1 Tax=Tepidiforma sp. TaxID=2682230 RepID=UPI002ADE695B|nr:histidine kinase dimerization/phospho-acceptor domain-containing protein [Tepidiforma sp.]
MPEEWPPEPGTEVLRREAMGAFAHEIRTPLTSIRMVIELARRGADADGGLLLDRELAEMLLASVDDLQLLADELQEMSRLERGKVQLAPGPCDLRAAVAAAGEMLGGQPAMELAAPVPALEGPWDAARLVRALAGIARSVNRMGDGSGTVRLVPRLDGVRVRLEFWSGEPRGEVRPVAADAGFSYFRGRQLVVTMGGSVHCERRERFARVAVTLPLGDAGGGGGGDPR